MISPLCRHSGIQTFRHSGIQAFRHLKDEITDKIEL
jgi:hypothetical protein